MKSSGRIIAIIFACLLIAAAGVTAVILMGQKDNATESGDTYQTEEQTEITVSAETEETTKPLALETSAAATTTRPPETEKTEETSSDLSEEGTSGESSVKDSVSEETEQQTTEASSETIATKDISEITGEIAIETRGPEHEEKSGTQESLGMEPAPEISSIEVSQSSAGLPVVSDVMY